jgi:hypothetical protein
MGPRRVRYQAALRPEKYGCFDIKPLLHPTYQKFVPRALIGSRPLRLVGRLEEGKSETITALSHVSLTEECGNRLITCLGDALAMGFQSGRCPIFCIDCSSQFHELFQAANS